MTAIAPQDRYRRLDLLGRGGMGEVFLADDLVLRRKVAIKIVHRSTLANPRAEKLLRREAKAAASLDNPFICKVYEVGEQEGRVFIAMEYIQGETLRQRMMKGPLLIREILALAREIADGLDEAARQRIVHRDLKPSNIIITPQGHVKIMDFGLAKRLPGDESEESSVGTPEGMVVGTREYMSPEQLRAKPLEPSSDLFALGLILYEAVSGAHPFKKAAAIDTQFAILNEDAPDLDERRPEAPPELCDLIHRLLSRVASDRPRIGELRERLAGISESARPEGPNEKTVGASASVEAFVARKPRVVLILGLFLVFAVTALSLWVGFRKEPTAPRARMATLMTWPSNEEHASLSPDSRNVSFISNRDGVKDIWLMDLSGGEPRRLTSAPGDLTAQTFSEDGKEIAYTLESEAQKLFQTVRIDGGPPTRSLSLPADTRIRRMIRWVGTDVFMETQTRDLVRLSLPSGQLATVPTLPKGTSRPSSFDVSMRGQTIAFAAQSGSGFRSIWTQSPAGRLDQVTGPGFSDNSPFFTDASGKERLFFESNRSGQEDLWSIEGAGHEPRQITFGSNRESIEAVSADGRTMVFSEVVDAGSIFSYDPRTGARAQLSAENTRDVTPSLSASGLVAFGRTPLAARIPTELSSIHTGQLDHGRLRETRMVARDGFGPVLSPNGRWLAFMSRPGNAGAPRMNVLDLSTGHSRDLGGKPIKSLVYMALTWSFPQSDYAWSERNDLVFVQGSTTSPSRIVRSSGDHLETVLELEAGEVVSTLSVGADPSLLYFVKTRPDAAGGVVVEVAQGRPRQLLSTPVGELAILGQDRGHPIVAHQRRLDEDVLILALEPSGPRELTRLRAELYSWRWIPGLKSVAFSRRDARGVENIFLKQLITGKETQVTTNDIQGIAFSPVADSGAGPLLFSQQMRNKDLGIIRIDQK